MLRKIEFKIKEHIRMHHIIFCIDYKYFNRLKSKIIKSIYIIIHEDDNGKFK